MVNNLKCLDCTLIGKCVAYNKLKPFLEEAKTDLRVTLNFEGCDDFVDMDAEDAENIADIADVTDDEE